MLNRIRGMLAAREKKREQQRFAENRKQWLEDLKARLENKEFTIISNNCIGGIIYHDLGLRFDTPTINLYFKDMADFVTFSANLSVYTACPMTDVTGEENRGFPCGRLEPEDGAYKPITLCFQHDSSFAEAKSGWERRCGRIHYDDLFFIYEFYNGIYDDSTLSAFDALPYENKVALVHKPVEGIACARTVHCYRHEDDRGVILEFDGITGKRYLDEFDYVGFLNQGVKQSAGV